MSDKTLREAAEKAIHRLCGRIGGCLGDTCGCVKGTLDGQPSSESRRKAGWEMLRAALADRADGKFRCEFARNDAMPCDLPKGHEGVHKSYAPPKWKLLPYADSADAPEARVCRNCKKPVVSWKDQCSCDSDDGADREQPDSDKTLREAAVGALIALREMAGESHRPTRLAWGIKASTELRAALADSADKPDCCSICAGTRKTLTGEPCICKTGTIYGELDALRREVLDSADAPEGPSVEQIARILCPGYAHNLRGLMTDDDREAGKACARCHVWAIEIRDALNHLDAQQKP